MDGVTKLINVVQETQDRVLQTSKQRRGGVTDLYGVDYSDEIDYTGDAKENPSGAVGKYYMAISGDLDRFQRWYFKVIVQNSKKTDWQTDVVPLHDVELSVTAQNSTTGQTEEIDLTPILKQVWKCNWIGDAPKGEGIFPNNKPMEGYDLMHCAWFMNKNQQEALFSPGEKVFYIKAIGQARVTIRNYIKYSHIN